MIVEAQVKVSGSKEAIWAAITHIEKAAGGGKPGLPNDVRLELELLTERRFGNGMAHLRYQTRS